MKAQPALELAGGADRPDPAQGVFSTMLVRDGAAVDVGAHLARLERSVGELYGRGLPANLEEQIAAAAAVGGIQRLRVSLAPRGASIALIEVETTPLAGEPEPTPALLAPAILSGGLGCHKWRDRRLVAQLERTLGAEPLIVDVDGEVLEAATANVWIVEGTTLTTPPLDGRLLPGTVRQRALAAAPAVGLAPREEPIALDRLTAADEILLSSAIRSIRPAALVGEGSARFELGARLREALLVPAP
jgi:para-aminobenzoate synthetase/4-amino-4-deoxychorismate lyase